MLSEYWRGGGAGKTLCDDVETVREFTYLDNRGSACRNEATSTAIKRCFGVKIWECGEILYRKTFSLFTRTVEGQQLYDEVTHIYIKRSTGVKRSNDSIKVRL